MISIEAYTLYIIHDFAVTPVQNFLLLAYAPDWQEPDMSGVIIYTLDFCTGHIFKCVMCPV